MCDPGQVESLVPSVVIGAEEQLFALRLPPRVRGTYLLWVMGYDPYFLMSRETYYRHAQIIEDYGADIRANRRRNSG